MIYPKIASDCLEFVAIVVANVVSFMGFAEPLNVAKGISELFANVDRVEPLIVKAAN